MPYGVTIEGDGTSLPKIVGNHSKQRNDFAIGIPAGPCNVAISWDGDEGLNLLHYSGGAQRGVIAAIPAKRGGCSPSPRHDWCEKRRLCADYDHTERKRQVTRHYRGLPSANRLAGAVV